ncbi:MAG TPA: hypothetical protein VF981_11835 [Gemmatimonadaceae bacterium]
MAALLMAGGVFAEDNVVKAPRGSVVPRPEIPAGNLDQRRAEAEDALARLRRTNPDLYREQKVLVDRRFKIAETVEQFRAGRLTYAQAKQALKPLLLEDISSGGERAKGHIAELEERAELLREQLKNPEQAVDARVDQLLGRRE